jgi:hypothetical protein
MHRVLVVPWSMAAMKGDMILRSEIQTPRKRGR